MIVTLPMTCLCSMFSGQLIATVVATLQSVVAGKLLEVSYKKQTVPTTLLHSYQLLLQHRMDDERPKKIKKRQRDADEEDDQQPEEWDFEDWPDITAEMGIRKGYKVTVDDDDDDEKSGDPLEADDEDEEMAYKRRALMKAQKKFSIALVEEAKENDWEEHEIARLVILISKVRELNAVKTLKLLQRCEVCTPIVLATLSDSEFEISSSQLIGALYDQAGHVDKFIEVIEDRLEQDLLNLTDPDTIDALFNTAECSMNGLQLRRFCRVICDNTKSKKLCGRILNVFASRMLSSEATSFICETVSFDFFLDLSGSMRGFYKEIPEIRDSVEAFLTANRNMDGEGELIDSDVDEDGNLCGFIDDDFGTKKTKKAPRKILPYGSDSDSDSGKSSLSESESDNESEEFTSRLKQDFSETKRFGQACSDTESEPEGDSVDGVNSEDMDYEIDINSGSDSGQDNDDLDYDKTAIDTMDSPRGLDNSNSDSDSRKKSHSKKSKKKDMRDEIDASAKIKKKSKMERKKEKLAVMDIVNVNDNDDDDDDGDEIDEVDKKVSRKVSGRVDITNDDGDEDQDYEKQDVKDDSVQRREGTIESLRKAAHRKWRKRVIADDDDDDE